LKEAKMIDTATESTGKHKESLGALLDSSKDNTSLQPFRESNKKLFNVFNYDLRPLIEQLPDHAVAYLKEYLDISGDVSVEEVIWEMAEAMSRFINVNDYHPDKPQQPLEKTLAEMVKFSRTWLRQNWRWAQAELERSLKPGNGQASVQPEAVSSPQVSLEDIPLKQEVEEVETSIKEVEEGTLSGWRILYTDNMTVTPNHLLEVGGTTLQERQDAFKRLLVEEHIACPINPDSVVRALEWVVDVPPEIEQLRMRQEINGLTFRKLKRKGVRIFYIPDPDQKTLVFFIYKKVAQDYRF
jgi:mRNA-degrading endonuclease RelE of RelBE toxin-antitoxin system